MQFPIAVDLLFNKVCRSLFFVHSSLLLLLLNSQLKFTSHDLTSINLLPKKGEEDEHIQQNYDTFGFLWLPRLYLKIPISLVNL